MEVSPPMLQAGFSPYLEYLDAFEDAFEVPERSPRRPKTMPISYHDEAPNSPQYSQYSSSASMHDGVSSDYTLTSPRSVSSSLFSMEHRYTERKPESLESASLEEFLDEIEEECEICTVKDVVTIVKYHDQWDPRKVAIVPTR